MKLPIPVPHYRMPANFRIDLTCGGTVTTAPGVNAMQPAPAAEQPQQAAAAPPALPPAAAPPAHAGAQYDPCTMLSAPDVASALGVGVQSLSSAQRPSPNECAWGVAAHGGAPAQNVVLVVQSAQAAKAPCQGLGCLGIVQSVLGTAGVPGLPPQFSEAFTDAQIIGGLGDKAAWKDGRLTVVKADLAFQVLVSGSGSPALATSEALAHAVIDHVNP